MVSAETFYYTFSYFNSFNVSCICVRRMTLRASGKLITNIGSIFTGDDDETMITTCSL